MGTNKLGAGVVLLCVVLGNFFQSEYAEAQTSSTSSPQTATTTALVRPLTGYCSTEAFYNGQGEYAVVWSVFANPANNLTYTWSGAASTTGSDIATVNELFSTSGRKTAVVTVSNGEQSMTLACGVEINIPSVSTTTLEQLDLIGGRCRASVSGMTIFWSGSSSGAEGETVYNWVGDGVSTTTTDASFPIEVAYTTEGVKSAQVRMQADGQTISLLCQAKIASTTSDCFIATAAFGTEMEPEVVTLRKFRDEKLLTNKIGEAFVRTYYKVSPPIADFIRNKDHLKLIVRTGLKPIIWTAEKAQAR
jgi:hypothetical protein